MGTCISFGSFNKNSIYIFLATFFAILTNYIFGYDFNNSFVFLKLFQTETQLNLSRHSIIHDFFCYITVLIISFCLHKYEIKANRRESHINIEKSKCLIDSKKSSPIELIHNDSGEDLFQKSPYIVIFIIALWVFQKFLLDFYYKSGLRDLDYWMFELIIISYLNTKMFNQKLYSHQKCAIYFNSVFCLIFKLSSFFITFFKVDNEHKNLYRKSYWFIPIGIVSYILIIFLKVYSISKIKWLIDLKYISPSKLLLISGFVGIIINFIICIVSSFIKCQNFGFRTHFCEVSYYNYEEQNKARKNISRYLENYDIYFKTLTGEILNENYNKMEIALEVFIIFFGSISNFLYLYFYILIIKYLTPVHFIFTNSIYFFFIQIILLINNKIRTEYYFTGNNKFTSLKFFKFIFEILGEFFSFFGFMIYLELIELNFCGLNYNLKKCIIRRSIQDLDFRVKYESISLFNDEDVEEEEEKEDKISFSSNKYKFSELSLNKKSSN